jgi:hypothetical protein
MEDFVLIEEHVKKPSKEQDEMKPSKHNKSIIQQAWTIGYKIKLTYQLITLLRVLWMSRYSRVDYAIIYDTIICILSFI